MEYWDIYDKNKQLTGRKMKRNDWCLKEDEYHLTVRESIRRPDGKYLITRRVLSQSTAPGWWEVSGGAAQAGESSEEAVRREVLEETGLDVNGCAGGYMFTYHRENPREGDNYFVDVYRFEKDFKEEDLHLQTEETAGYKIVFWLIFWGRPFCIMSIIRPALPIFHIKFQVQRQFLHALLQVPGILLNSYKLPPATLEYQFQHFYLPEHRFVLLSF